MKIKILVFCLLLVVAGTAILASEQEAAHKITIIAGPTALDNCPVTSAIPNDASHGSAMKAGQSLKLAGEDGEIPATILAGKDGLELVFVVNGIEPFKFKTYKIIPGEVSSKNAVSIAPKGKALDITIGGKPFTTLLYDTNKKMPRPIFYPLFGPGGARLTRGYPMETFEGEKEDHPHHQSLYVSHCDVNGTNFWNFGKDQGLQKLTKLNATVSSPACGRIDATLDWKTGDDKTKILEEHRIVTIWGTPEAGRAIDFDLTFTATEGDVKFGDTKEGGLLSLRVAKKIREDKREKNDPDSLSGGGRITNSNGQTGSGAWGKPAPWCDYSGVAGKGKAGLTIMDSPQNPFFPTYYHVRTYGLFTANPFGIHNFVNKNVDGTQILKKGESWRFRYRLYIHAGDVETGGVADAYNRFAVAPRVILH